jgi:hypothetical protein
LQLLIYKTIQFFIPGNSFLHLFNSCNFSLLFLLFLIKRIAKILLPVLSCSFAFYRWFFQKLNSGRRVSVNNRSGTRILAALKDAGFKKITD